MSQNLEGRRPVVEALRSGRPIIEILLASGGDQQSEIRELAQQRGIRIRDVARSEIDRIAASAAPQGCIAVVPDFNYANLDHILQASRDEPLLLVALDGVTDPHNVGALARSAEAAGAHAIIIPERRAAGITPVVEKSAAGALAWLPVVRTVNLTRCLDGLKPYGIWVVALDGDATTSIWEAELFTESICIVVGAEGAGVSRLVAQRSDLRVSIPMKGHVGSLNASVAGGLALFEVVRRRGLVT